MIGQTSLLVKISILSLRREGIRQSEQCLSPPLPLLAGGALQAARAASRQPPHQTSTKRLVRVFHQWQKIEISAELSEYCRHWHVHPAALRLVDQ
jgi:hypothetical protein